ncbi:MAG: T9SS type A sorting domain-containing protein [Bacteroidia bacterium]
MRIKKLILFILFLSSFNGYSQHWQSLNGGGNNQVYALYGDTVNNVLYAGGGFTSMGGIHTQFLAKWDGTTWDSIDNNLNRLIYSFAMYKNQLVTFADNFTPNRQQIIKLNGSIWDSIGSNFKTSPLGGFEGVVTLKNELYAYGVFDTINGITYNSIAKFDTITNTWLSLGFPYKFFTDPPTIRALAIYHNELYAAGLITDSTGVIANIAKYDGSNWSIVGGGIHGASDQVFDLEVYQDELYASGEFKQSSGNAANFIQRWNDTTWRDVGGSVNDPSGQIFDMFVYNNKLYAGGYYHYIGGILAPSIAMWDGTNWCGFGNNDSSSVEIFATINHNLFIQCMNRFDGINVGYLAQWIGGSYTDTCGHSFLEINEISEESQINIYPNPATNQITIEFDLIETKNAVIEIRNILGQIVFTETVRNITGKQAKSINISEFSNGVYFVRLQNNNQTITKKFIKE